MSKFCPMCNAHTNCTDNCNQCLAEEETTHTPKIKMTNAQFNEFYKKQLEDLRAECDQMVADGECDQEYADFRYYMKMDEILWLSEDDIEIIDEE